MQDFTSRTAVITGGASGIGRALAERCVAEGMNVVIGDVEKGALDLAVEELGVVGVVTDVTDPEQMQALADAAVKQFGGVNLFCNNAGVGGGGLSWETPLSTWEWVLNVDLWGVIHGVRTFVPILMQQTEAHIVNTVSVAGLVASPYMGPYNAAKHGVVAISETLHHELAAMAPQVKVSVLCPGWVNTRIHESSRNRPEHLQVEGETEGVGEIMRGFIESGMPPSEIAGKVFDAIRGGQFWIITHDAEGDFWVESVNRRIKSLEARSNPQMGFPS